MGFGTCCRVCGGGVGGVAVGAAAVGIVVVGGGVGGTAVLMLVSRGEIRIDAKFDNDNSHLANPYKQINKHRSSKHTKQF